MFSAISWKTFLLVSLLAGGVYYLISAVWLYRYEIRHWLKGRVHRHGTAPSVADDLVMGTAVAASLDEIRTSTVEASQVAVDDQFGSPEAESVTLGKTPIRWHEIDKLLEEIRTVLKAVADSKSTAEECRSFLCTLLSRYPHLKQTSYRDSIAFYILQLTRESLPFQLSLPEVLSWWDEL